MATTKRSRAPARLGYRDPSATTKHSTMATSKFTPTCNNSTTACNADSKGDEDSPHNNGEHNHHAHGDEDEQDDGKHGDNDEQDEDKQDDGKHSSNDEDEDKQDDGKHSDSKHRRGDNDDQEDDKEDNSKQDNSAHIDGSGDAGKVFVYASDANPADVDPYKTKPTTSQFVPIQRDSIYVLEDDIWGGKGRYQDAWEMNDEVEWTWEREQHVLRLLVSSFGIGGSAPSSVPSSHVSSHVSSHLSSFHDEAPVAAGVAAGSNPSTAEAVLYFCRAVAAKLGVSDELMSRDEITLPQAYSKYLAYHEACEKYLKLVNAKCWPLDPSYPKAFAHVGCFPDLLQWLQEVKKEDGGPSDVEIWGELKPSYTFADLFTWLRNHGVQIKERKKEVKEEEKEEIEREMEMEVEKEKGKGKGKGKVLRFIASLFHHSSVT
ncbi:hypothetical protein BD779DRAFT_1681567 [Infundibulicybe gibba]|nr:hypothetical protein BD779DRAFT_1681567 [Infundibulicybe gibba]